MNTGLAGRVPMVRTPGVQCNDPQVPGVLETDPMPTDDFFRTRRDTMIDLRHRLAVLAHRPPWPAIEVALVPKLAHQDRVSCATASCA